MIPREVEEAIDRIDQWSPIRPKVRAALVAAIERAIGAQPSGISGQFVTRQRYDEVAKALAIAAIGHKAAEAERDRLAAALATAQARIESARAYLGSAIVQTLPSDDQIIADHIRTAHDALSPATGPGQAPATEKGTGAPASDTGTSGGGASPAVAPDYEAVCGSSGKPQP